MPHLVLKEIGNLNLSYLMLTQRLIEKDMATAMARLGLNSAQADFLGGLSLSDTVKLASTDILLCRFRFDDQGLMALAADCGKKPEASGREPEQKH